MNAYIYEETLHSCLEELSNLSYQTDIWANLNNPLNLVSSYAEATCGIFDDALVGDALEEGAIIYNHAVTQAIRELDAMTNNVREDNRNIFEFIHSSDMHSIRDKAAEILQLIRESSLEDNTTVFLALGESPAH
jgi:hypothetical protein